jgi:KDO2-lipid IV(A) lauroyltransferase
MKVLRYRLEAAFIAWVSWLARCLPRRFLIALGSRMAEAFYFVAFAYRRTTLENLRHALGDELPERELRRIGLASWTHLGRIGFDALTFPTLSPDSVGSIVRYQGLDHIRGAYAKGKGVMLFSGHFGHWELVALMQGFLGMPLALVTRRLDNPLLENRLARLRTLSGNEIIHRQGAVREMLKALRRNLGVAIVIDQDAKRSGIFVPFFGRPAATTPTLAAVALKTGVPIVPVFSVPRPDGSYDVIYEPEVKVVNTGDRDADVHRLTAQCTAIIEQWVRRHPEIWLWMHRRWKTAPPPSLSTGA